MFSLPVLENVLMTPRLNNDMHKFINYCFLSRTTVFHPIYDATD